MKMRVLLIVDDCEEIGRGLRRCLRRCFDEIVLATSEQEAERILMRPENPPTHLLCDHYLGPNTTAGVELVSSWRSRFPGLATAAVFSGSELAEVPAGSGVDRIFRKPLDIDALERFFSAA